MTPKPVILEQQIARLRAIGWRDSFRIEATTWRRLVKSTLAATIAWEVGVLMDSPRPMLASLGALLVVQVTVRASFARSLQVMAAVTIGLGAALLLGHLLGLHWWSIGLLIFGALVVGEILRLGPLSNQAALSALLALSLGSAYGWQRVIDTAVGALIGFAVSALIAPPSLVKEASQALRRVGEDLGALLVDIGAGLKAGADRSSVERWLGRARDINGDVRNAEATVSQGEESLRLNMRAKADEAVLKRVSEARLALEHAITQTRGLARTTLDLSNSDALDGSGEVFETLGELLEAIGPEVTAFGRLQDKPDSATDRALSRQAHASALDVRDRAALAVQSHAAHPSGRLFAALLVDIERLMNEVDIVDGAHAAAVATPSPS